MKNVYVTDKLTEDVLAYLRLHLNVTERAENWPIERVWEQLAEADGLLTGGLRIDGELLNAAPRLRIVSDISDGYNNFDLEEMKKRGVVGTHTPEVVDDPVADLIIGLMIAAGRRMTELDAYMRKGLWAKGDNEKLFGLEISGKTLGIIGMGGIGSAVARKAHLAFGMEIVYHNRKEVPSSALNGEAVRLPMEDVLRKADYLVIMTPLTDQTYHLIGKKELQMMKSTAILVNAARGPVIHEEELIEALREKTIYAAALDVYEKEPIEAENELLRLPNTVLTPHIGTAMEKARHDMAMKAAKNMVDGLSGRTPENVVKELRQ